MRTNHTCWKMVSWFCMTALGPTLLRMSVNCCMDTAGRCYPIRPTAPTWVPRTSTCSQNWKSTCVMCVSLRWRTFLLPLPDASDSSTVLETWQVSWTFQNAGMQSFGRRGTTLKDYNTLPHIWCSILWVLRFVHFFWDGPCNMIYPEFHYHAKAHKFLYRLFYCHKLYPLILCVCVCARACLSISLFLFSILS